MFVSGDGGGGSGDGFKRSDLWAAELNRSHTSRHW